MRLEHLDVIVFQAIRCFVTLPSGERVYYKFRRGKVKGIRLGVEGRLAPAVKLIDGEGDLRGWFPVSKLRFEMPNGEVVA